MPNSSGKTGSKWFRCDRCGRHYPIKYIRRQDGARVCTYLPCFDELGRQESNDPRVVRLAEPARQENT